MKILIHDTAQNASNITSLDKLLTPALFETSSQTDFSIDFQQDQVIDCIGIANTDATSVTINSHQIVLEQAPNTIQRKTLRSSWPNGLYEIPKITSKQFSIKHTGKYLGRIALGQSRSLGISKNKEQGYYSTNQFKITASGSVVKGSGGIVGRQISVDTRYQINQNVFQDFENAIDYISMGYPFFLKFDEKETQTNIQWPRLYAGFHEGFKTLVLQTGIRNALYSYRFSLQERF